jgi:peptide/nickel transport system substrate-binding protein
MSLDPLFHRVDPAVRDLGRLLYRSLLRLDDRALPTPDLAAGYTVSGDGLTYRFTLRPALRWSDGRPITVADVAATVAVVQDPAYPDAALAASWKNVAVTIVPPSTIVATLPMPRASFAASLTDLPVLPATALLHHTPAALAISAAAPLPTSGPYVVTSSDRNAVRLAVNPRADPAPSLRSVELRLEPTADAALGAFTAGSVDAVLTTTPAARATAASTPGAILHDITTFRFVDLLFNTHRPGLDDATVRHAVSGAIDRGALIAATLGGAARAQVDAIPAGIPWITNRTPEQPDPQLSRRALDAAGWREDSGGVRVRNGDPLAYVLTVPDADPLRAVARELARQLGVIGISVTIRPVPLASYEQTVLFAGQFDLALADWDSGPDPDVSSFWRSNAVPPRGANVSGEPTDLFLDQDLDALATEADIPLRQAAAEKVDQRLADDTPAVFLYAPVVTLAVGDRVDADAVPADGAPADRFDDVVRWRRL